MKNYFLTNVRLHHFKSLSCRKLANIRKSMQIRKPFVQKNINFFCFLPNFFGKMTSLQPVKCSISNFWYYLTQPILYGIYNNFNPLLDRIMGNNFPRLSLCLNLQVQISLLRTCNCLQIDVET